VQWLAVSIVLSVMLTIVLNVARRAFPDLGARVGRRLAEFTAPKLDDPARRDDRVRVIVPWKAMIVGSLILTILVNVVRWAA
jgi:hypothetical protein